MRLLPPDVGQSTEKLMDRVWDAGQRWLGTFFRDHELAATEAGNENARGFLRELAHRVSELEAGTKDQPGSAKRIEELPS